MAQKNTKHWAVLVCVSFMFAASAGIINNVIGVFYTPVSESLGVLRGTFALHSTITMVLVGFISLVTPQLIHRFGWKRVLTIGVILAFIGTAGMAFTEYLVIFYLLGAIRGIGAGLFGLVPMAMLINNWFHLKNGLAISLASAFSGLIGMIFAPIIANVVAEFGWQNGFIAMGTAVVLLALPAIIYPYSLSPEQEDLMPYGYEMHATMKKKKTTEKRPTVALKSVFISFGAMMIFSVLHTNILGMNQHLSSYGESIGMTLEFSGYMLSAVMLGNILFKLVIGPMSDRVGAIKSTIIMNAVNVIGLMILIAWPSAVPSIGAAFLFGSVFCVGSVALPLLSNQFFGKNLSERVFPILTFTSNIGAAVSNTMVGYIFDFTGSYQIAFLIAVVFQAINLVLLFIAYKFSIQKLGEPQSLRS